METMKQMPLAEAVELAAASGEFFGQYFFPKTCRQASPEFHREMDEELENPENRFVSFMVFRDGAKTTKTRLFIAKRIAFQISRTILIVGKSQGAAEKTVRWLKKAVEFNEKFSRTFGLSKGPKWTDNEIVIKCDVPGAETIFITVIAMGITGSTRGLNIDDYRPDLIVVDDPCDEENTATPEQREKISELFFTSLKDSLAPRSESPHAKMVLLQTLLNEDDLISVTVKDPTWKSVVYGVFDEHGNSRWPERYPTADLLEDKNASIARNQLHLWMREKECQIVSRASSAFLPEWLEYWDILPDDGFNFLAIDPTPPPKDPTGNVKVLPSHDEFVVMALRLYKRKVYVCEVFAGKVLEVQKSLNEIFRMALKWNTKDVYVETVLFARVLRHTIEQEMALRRVYLNFKAVEDRRAKPLRIEHEVGKYAAQHQIVVHQSQHTLIEQYLKYPRVNHDDQLDALSLGLMSITPWMLDVSNVIEGDYYEVDDDLESLEWRPSV